MVVYDYLSSLSLALLTLSQHRRCTCKAATKTSHEKGGMEKSHDLTSREGETWRIFEKSSTLKKRKEKRKRVRRTSVVRPVEDRERLTPARPGLFVATARVREEHGRGFPRERGEEKRRRLPR